MSDQSRTTEDQAQSVPPLMTIDPASVANLINSFKEMLDAALSSTSASSSSLSPGTQLNQADKLKAADLRTGLLLGKIPEDSGLLIDAKTFAKLLDISKAMFYRLQAEEAIPAPVQLGRLKKWRLAEVLEWIESDCPSQRFWIPMKQQSAKRKRR